MKAPSEHAPRGKYASVVLVSSYSIMGKSGLQEEGKGDIPVPKQNKVYTIEDIARELGVSKTTVSRSISGKGRISKETREKVLAFIATHDYRPSSLAKALAQNKTYNLGLVLPSDYAAVDLPFFRESMSGICEVASAENYDVVLSMVDGKDLSQIQRQIYNRKVDGMIVSRSTKDPAVVNLLKEKQMPFVVIGPSDNEGILSVDNDNREACRELVSILLMKGMRRLALIGGSSRHMVTESRKKGYLDAFYQCGIAVEERLLLLDVEGGQQTCEAVQQVLDEGVDGIVCMDDVLTIQAVEYLREKGVRIPKDICLASCYDNPQLENNYPPITSLRFESKELGKNACRMLIEKVEGKIPEKKTPANYQVILRESTKI